MAKPGDLVRIPLPFDEAVADLLKVKPAPKPPKAKKKAGKRKPKTSR